MRSFVRTNTVVTAVGASLLLTQPGLAQEAPPSPELKVLERFIGSWEQEVVLKPAGWTPEKTKMTVTSKAEWILHGRVLQHRGVWSPGDIRSLGLMTYDAEYRAYRQWHFDSNGAIPRGEDKGTWDEASQTLTWKAALANGMSTTGTNRFVDKNAFEWTFVLKDATGKALLDIEARAKRK